MPRGYAQPGPAVAVVQVGTALCSLSVSVICCPYYKIRIAVPIYVPSIRDAVATVA